MIIHSITLDDMQKFSQVAGNSLLQRVDLSLREWDFTRFHHQPDTPFYHHVPKDLDANRAHRAKLIKLGNEDPAAAKELWEMCARDILFWANTFCYTFSPKDYPDDPHRPFLTWPYQDDALLRISRAIGKRDIALPKSRDLGASWLCLLVLTHRWQFKTGQTFLLTSRKQEYVDAPSQKSLFWKIEYLFKMMPAWMTPKINRIKNHFGNEDNGSSMDGEATVPDLGRGDRLTAIFMDEHAAMEKAAEIAAATQSATKTRISNSTPAGTAGDAAEFYKTCFNPATEVLPMWWPLHPEKSLGLYWGDPVTGQIVHYDDWEFPSEYNFLADGKLRSVWYDEECARSTSDQTIAQELDIDFLKSGSPFFKPELIEKLSKECKPPDRVGELVMTPMGDIEFEPTVRGRLRLWMTGEPRLERPYVVGCDIAAGTGGDQSSNSVASIFDPIDGLKVGEFASQEISPEDFARYVGEILCPYFHDAYLIWEANGLGMSFGKIIVKELRYMKFYWRQSMDVVIEKNQKKPGWWSGTKEKQILLKSYGEALKTGRFRNLSIEAVRECGEYVFAPNGTVVHDKARTATDGSSTGENHGDRVIADALAWRFGQDYANHIPTAPQKEPPQSSFAYRRMLAERERKRESYW